MKCPFCSHLMDRVVDSREAKEGHVIRRRRECLSCRKRFTSYERIEEIPYMVVKKDGIREPFNRDKLRSGLLKAVEKRPVPPTKLDAIVDEIEGILQESPDREIETRVIGERVMDRLRDLDKIAYVRFASVYRQFGDLDSFLDELRSLMERK